jgi:hypothetical protein
MSNAIISAVTEQMEQLPENLQHQVLEFVRKLKAAVPQGIPGKTCSDLLVLSPWMIWRR